MKNRSLENKVAVILACLVVVALCIGGVYVYFETIGGVSKHIDQSHNRSDGLDQSDSTMRNTAS